jgi:hypothetical protein
MSAPTSNLKLFMVYVGGHTPTSNLEVHDMRFVVGAAIEDCYRALQNQWWGDPDTLHMDCWSEVSQVDGYNVTLSSKPSAQEENLFFVNLGGYDPTQFDELHKNVLIVASSPAKAKGKAKEDVTHWQVPHKDTLFDIEKMLCLNEQLQKEGLYIHLQKSDTIKEFAFTCTYKPISAKALAKRK